MRFFFQELTGARVDELNKLACSQCIGLHSSAGGALQRECRGHGFVSCWSPEKRFFFGLVCNWLHVNCDSTAMVTYLLHLKTIKLGLPICFSIWVSHISPKRNSLTYQVIFTEVNLPIRSKLLRPHCLESLR